jgi:hypothetical protein
MIIDQGNCKHHSDCTESTVTSPDTIFNGQDQM